MRIAFLVKKRDACYHIRIMTPSSHLVLHGHQLQEELLEQQEYCQRCNTGMHEFHFFNEATEFKCPRCGNKFGVDIAAWKKNIREIIEWADVVVFQRTTDLDHLKLMRMVKAAGKPVILENDDDYINVPSWNTGYAYYAQRRGVIEEMQRLADCVTVTTQGLKDLYSNYNKDVVVLPNCIDMEILDVEPKMPDVAVFNKRGIRIQMSELASLREGKKLIGWGGSPTHEKDLELIVGAVKRLIRTEKVMFGFVGYVHRAILELLKEDEIVLFGLVPVVAYFSLYKTINFDIGIAPVAPVKFNEGKSPNKLLEYFALRVLPVASDFVTYKDYIHRGFLAHNNDEYGWYCAMRNAVNCEDRAERIADNRKHVEENFDIKDKISLWEECYQRKIEERSRKTQ